jgi:hypothetical protein
VLKRWVVDCLTEIPGDGHECKPWFPHVVIRPLDVEWGKEWCWWGSRWGLG